MHQWTRRVFAVVMFLAPIQLVAVADELNAVSETQTGTLVVQVVNLKSGDGKLRMVLFDSKRDFLKRPLHQTLLQRSSVRRNTAMQSFSSNRNL